MTKRKEKKDLLPVGRPTKYSEVHNEKAYKLCLLGATDAQIADVFGITTTTLYEWKLVHPKFSDALKGGKEHADAAIAKSLFHRAKGYSHEDVHISNYQGEITLTPITKHYPPDTTACIFWLKNRQKEQWRDTYNVNQKTTITGLAEVLQDVESRVEAGERPNSGLEIQSGEIRH